MNRTQAYELTTQEILKLLYLLDLCHSGTIIIIFSQKQG